MMAIGLLRWMKQQKLIYANFFPPPDKMATPYAFWVLDLDLVEILLL